MIQHGQVKMKNFQEYRNQAEVLKDKEINKQGLIKS